MGFHKWTGECPYCGFEAMSASSCDAQDFEMACPICGYAKWTEEKIPDHHDVEFAKRKLAEMRAEEKRKFAELFYEDGIPLVSRLKQG